MGKVKKVTRYAKGGLRVSDSSESKGEMVYRLDEVLRLYREAVKDGIIDPSDIEGSWERIVGGSVSSGEKEG